MSTISRFESRDRDAGHAVFAEGSTVDMNSTEESIGPLERKLAEIERLITTDAARAAVEAEQVLLATPEHPGATLLLGIARRFTGNSSGAIAAPTATTR